MKAIIIATMAILLMSCSAVDRVGSPRDVPPSVTSQVWVWWSVVAQGGEGKTYARIFFNDKPHLDGVFLELPQSGGEWMDVGSKAVLKVVANTAIYTQGEIYAEFPEGRKQIGFKSENSGSFSLPAEVK